MSITTARRGTSVDVIFHREIALWFDLRFSLNLLMIWCLNRLMRCDVTKVKFQATENQHRIPCGIVYIQNIMLYYYNRTLDPRYWFIGSAVKCRTSGYQLIGGNSCYDLSRDTDDWRCGSERSSRMKRRCIFSQNAFVNHMRWLQQRSRLVSQRSDEHTSDSSHRR